jgi:hypothetical protein
MLSLASLSRAEKLRMMEALWRDLSMDDGALASPEWHGSALQEAETATAAGQAQWMDWDQAKEALRLRARSSQS